MHLSDIIARRILELIEESDKNTAEIQRNELASALGCVPSQINYVLSSRFTPEHGFIIESRRGGGGYIKITRIQMNRSSAIMHIINSLGQTVDPMVARIVIENCLESNLVSHSTARLMAAAISATVLKNAPVEYRDYLRAAILKQMLICELEKGND